MKTKVIAVSLMLTFTSCALFAQEKTDSIPKDNSPQTDTTTRKDTTISIRTTNANPNNGKILKENSNWNSPVKEETVFVIFPAKENEETTA